MCYVFDDMGFGKKLQVLLKISLKSDDPIIILRCMILQVLNTACIRAENTSFFVCIIFGSYPAEGRVFTAYVGRVSYIMDDLIQKVGKSPFFVCFPSVLTSFQRFCKWGTFNS